MRLAGKRFVASVETDKGRRFAQGLVKLLLGGDEVTVRDLFKSEFTYLPEYKLWFAANDAPKVSDDDEAIWRRLRRAPFVHKPATKDPNVKKFLRDPVQAGPAILAWAVKGCLAWQEKGLGASEAVTKATTATGRRWTPSTGSSRSMPWPPRRCWPPRRGCGMPIWCSPERRG